MGEDPAILQIRIVEGEGQVYAIGSRATRGVTVEVTNENGKPVEGATVNFRLPEQGPGGQFADGSKMEVATTRPDGRASVWGMQWNRTPGSFEIRITAARGQNRAGTVCPVSLTDSVDPGQATRSSGHGGHKWLWIGLGAAAAAGAGGFAAIHSSASSQNAAAAPGATQIGTPTIIVGHP